MRVIKKIALNQDWNMIRDNIRSGCFQIGDEIEINGCLWRVLDTAKNKIFIWQHDGPGEDVVFNVSGSNIYEGSDIEAYARGEFLRSVPPEMLELVTDEGFNPLSYDEVRRYLRTEGERIVTDEDGDTCFWWLRSATRGSAGLTWYVYSSGDVSYYDAYSAYRFAPACHLEVN